MNALANGDFGLATTGLDIYLVTGAVNLRTPPRMAEGPLDA